MERLKHAATKSIEVILACVTGAVVFMVATDAGSVEAGLVGLIICCILLLYTQ